MYHTRLIGVGLVSFQMAIIFRIHLKKATLLQESYICLSNIVLSSRQECPLHHNCLLRHDCLRIPWTATRICQRLKCECVLPFVAVGNVWYLRGLSLPARTEREQSADRYYPNWWLNTIDDSWYPLLHLQGMSSLLMNTIPIDSWNKNIFAVRWAPVHPLHTHLLKHLKVKRAFYHFWSRAYRRTNERTDG